MSASNRTFLYIQDKDPSLAYPIGDSPVDFADYEEAMSYAKWMSILYISSAGGRIIVWNYNGGSGTWTSGVWAPQPNNNWP